MSDPLCPQQHTHPKHNPNRCIFCEYGAAVRTHERAKTLDAARKAIEAVDPPSESYDDWHPKASGWHLMQSKHYEGRSMMRQDSFSQGLWTGWAIGTLMLLIPIIFLAVTQ